MRKRQRVGARERGREGGVCMEDTERGERGNIDREKEREKKCSLRGMPSIRIWLTAVFSFSAPSQQGKHSSSRGPKAPPLSSLKPS